MYESRTLVNIKKEKPRIRIMFSEYSFAKSLSKDDKGILRFSGVVESERKSEEKDIVNKTVDITKLQSYKITKRIP